LRLYHRYNFRLACFVAIFFSGIVPASSVKAKLSVVEVGATYARLTWVAPGDDLDSGQASLYDIRLYTSEITEQNWDLAQTVRWPFGPGTAGQMDSITIGNLNPGTIYYFAVRTADEVLNWSEISVVSYTTLHIDSNGEGTILISMDTVSAVTATTATIRWNTNIPSTSQVIYGPTSFDFASVKNLSLDSVHSVTLADLSPGQVYVCQTISGDTLGNLTSGRTLRFITTSIVTNIPTDAPIPVTLSRCINLQPVLKVINIDTNIANNYRFQVSADSLFPYETVISGVVVQKSGDTTAWKVEPELSPHQVYFWRANVNDGDYCTTQTLIIDPIAYVYPNPFRLTEIDHATFVNIPANHNLNILTLSGTLVRHWPGTPSGTTLWDGTNSDGLLVASGVYLWFIEGTEIKGKLILIR
jgi:hypothetical protein